MRFIGDVHARFGEYLYLTDDVEESIQVGDFGVGFVPYDFFEHVVFKNVSTKHKFIRGNHDDPTYLGDIQQYHILNSHFIEDGTYEDDMFFCGGAHSIDKHLRTEWINWWRREELAWDEADRAIEKYENNKPSIMITHDCPFDIMLELFNYSRTFPNSTQTMLQEMWNIHKPKLWVFGHHHASRDVVIDGCRCVCLAELEAKDIDLDQYR